MKRKYINHIRKVPSITEFNKNLKLIYLCNIAIVIYLVTYLRALKYCVILTNILYKHSITFYIELI